jgi:hypothetical protein
VRSVYRAIAALERCGLLDVDRRQRGRGVRNVYRLATRVLS